MKIFQFQVYGAERTDYCLGFLEKYGEDAPIVKLLDENFERLLKISPVYIDQVNEIRRFLCENGFEKEVEIQDEAFLIEIKNRPRLQNVSLAERWESEGE